MISEYLKQFIAFLIKSGRLEWASHVQETKLHNKKSFTRKPKSKRSIGRPNLRWENCIRKDFLNFTEEHNENRNGKEVVKNREEWTRWSYHPKKIAFRNFDFGSYSKNILNKVPCPFNTCLWKNYL